MRWILTVTLLIIFSTSAYSDIIKEPIAITEEAVRDISEPVLEKLLQDLHENKKNDYISPFLPLVRDRLSSGLFEAIKKAYDDDYGSFASVTYLGYITRDESTRVIYKGFSRKHGHERQITLDFSKYIDEDSNSKVERIYLNSFEIE